MPVESNTLTRSRVWLGRAVCTRSGSRAGLVIPVAVLVWGATAGVTLCWPDQTPWDTTAPVGAATGGLAALILLAALGGLAQPAIRTRLHRMGPWLLVLGLLAVAWQVTTAKLALLPLPYFPPPQAIVDAFENDGALLLESLGYSLRLLALGYASGAMVGFLSGLAMGWSKAVNYWLHPLLRVIGPVPATAWLPVVFVGLFMGLGNSFVTLLVAEMLGVRAGLGWYIQWVQGWAAYPKLYAALLIMAALFSGLITLLFRVRNRVLAWQKGLIRW